jgi:hypothetical protein
VEDNYIVFPIHVFWNTSCIWYRAKVTVWLVAHTLGHQPLSISEPALLSNKHARQFPQHSLYFVLRRTANAAPKSSNLICCTQ